ncbi:MAG: esterase family protein [Lentimicrobium sp.]|nr:esterase family protein [Lentimicrobium sp.]
MKRISCLLISCLLLLTGFDASAGDKLVMESMTMHSRILGHEVRFSVILPEGYYAENRRYSVVYLLHGLGDDETSWLEYGRIGQYSRKAMASGDIAPVIFVMPQAFRTYYVNDYAGEFPYQDMLVQEFVPHIDSLFRTIPDAGNRAVMGYSMGGFGAMVLHLAHPGVFGVSVPLSMSVRTDEQYMTEEASGWDEQWGRLFGAPGLTGADRITGYYKLHSPFHTLPGLGEAEKKNLKIYMVNGDEEQTLCRSNEMLHILMHRFDVPHHYRVIDGGHSFRVWQAALPGALRYISDAFEGKPYRGDLMDSPAAGLLPHEQMMVVNTGGERVFAYVPDDYQVSDRKYPVVYFTGITGQEQMVSISSLVDRGIHAGKTTPMLIVFLPEKDETGILTLIDQLEKQLRIRSGYRFRSVAGYGKSAETTLRLLNGEMRFSSCLLTGAVMSSAEADEILSSFEVEKLKRTSLFIDAPDNGCCAEGNGELHMMLRDMEVNHEYRVRQGNGDEGWIERGLGEAINTISARFHR